MLRQEVSTSCSHHGTEREENDVRTRQRSPDSGGARWQSGQEAGPGARARRWDPWAHAGYQKPTYPCIQFPRQHLQHRRVQSSTGAICAPGSCCAVDARAGTVEEGQRVGGRHGRQEHLHLHVAALGIDRCLLHHRLLPALRTGAPRSVNPLSVRMRPRERVP